MKMTVTSASIWIREARADLSQGILEVDSHRKQQMKLDSLQSLVDEGPCGISLLDVAEV